METVTGKYNLYGTPTAPPPRPADSAAPAPAPPPSPPRASAGPPPLPFFCLCRNGGVFRLLQVLVLRDEEIVWLMRLIVFNIDPWMRRMPSLDAGCRTLCRSSGS